jgi:hypothetical protein
MPADAADTPSILTSRLMLTMWANIGLWQIDRLDEAADGYREAESAGLFGEAFVTRGRPEEWRPAYEKSSATITVAEYWQLAAERYFLLHALAEVRRYGQRLTGRWSPDNARHEGAPPPTRHRRALGAA